MAIHQLKDKQKEAVRRMGFGKLLDFGVEIPAQLGHYVVNKLDTKKMEIVVGDNTLKVDAETLNRLFGLSKEGKDLLSIPELKNLTGNVANWRAQYEKKEIVPSDICTRIMTSNDDDSVLFEIDFVMLFLTTMVDITSNGKCKLNVLHRITDDLDFKDINWAQYVLDKIKVCKNGWKPLDAMSYFTGPTTMLVIIYVEIVSCLGLDWDKTETPMITYWTKHMLKLRQVVEIKNGGFGLGKLKLEIDMTEEVGETSAKIIEQTPKQKGNVMFKEKLSKVTRRLEFWIKDKKEIEEQLKEIYNMFEDDQEVKDAIEKYESELEDKPNWLENLGEKVIANKSDMEATSKVNSALEDLDKTGDMIDYREIGSAAEHEKSDECLDIVVTALKELSAPINNIEQKGEIGSEAEHEKSDEWLDIVVTALKKLSAPINNIEQKDESYGLHLRG